MQDTSKYTEQPLIFISNLQTASPAVAMDKAKYFPINSSEDSRDTLCVATYQTHLWRRRFFMALALSTLFILLLLGVIVDGIQSPRHCSSPMTNVVIPYCMCSTDND